MKPKFPFYPRRSEWEIGDAIISKSDWNIAILYSLSGILLFFLFLSLYKRLRNP